MSLETQRSSKNQKTSKTVKSLSKAVSEKVLEQLDEEGLGLSEGGDDDAGDGEGEESDDVFIAPAQEVIAKGGSPRFKIRKDGQFIVTKNHPFSWDLLQKEFGSGFYSVTCIDQRGRSVKTQSQAVAPAPNSNEDLGVEFSSRGQSFSGEGRSNVMELLSFLKTFNSDSESKVREATDRARQEAKEASEKADREARRMSTEQGTLMSTMMTLIQDSNKQSQTLFLEMSKNNMQMLKEITESSNKMFERLNAKIEGAGNKKDGFDTATILKMLQDAEDRGYERQKTIYDLVEEKAERRAEELEEKRGDEKPESLASSIIKGFMPVISQAIQSQGQVTQGQPGARPTPAQIAQAKEAQEARLAHQRSVQFRAEQERLHKEKVKRQAAANTARQNTARVETPAPVVRDNLGLPKAGEAVNPGPSVREKLNGHFKDHVSSLVFPLVAEYLVKPGNPRDNAQECAIASLKALESRQISQKDVLAAFKFDDIIKLAHDSGLPPEADEWFKVYWSGIEGKFNDDVQVAPANEVEVAQQPKLE